MTAALAPASLYQCSVVESRPVGAYRLVSFVSREIAECVKPGQFLMVRRTGPSLDPLLPRPLGVHDVDADLIKILIEPVGKGTMLLAEAAVGDKLNVLGPLGRGFDLEGKGPAVIVGGGIGVAPFKLLARAMAERGRRVRHILGFKSRSQAASAELFQDFPLTGGSPITPSLTLPPQGGGNSELPAQEGEDNSTRFEVEVLTEDGSVGTQGLVSKPLPGCLAPPPAGEPAPEVFACGPGAMLREVARISRECGIRAQISVATHMACGIGSCQGCVVEAVGGYVKACTEGPVFEAEELKW